MKNLTGHALVLWALIFVVAAVLMIVIPFAHTEVFWLAGACTLIMFILVEVAYWRAFRKDEKMESRLLGWPIFKVGCVALAVQLAVGFALMAVAGILPLPWAAVIEVILFAAVIAAFVVKDAAREVVAQSEAQIAPQTEAWKAIRARANAIAAETGNADIKKLAEDIRYADPKPTPLDGQVAEMLEVLSGYATAENITKARNLLARRNEAAKAGK